MRARTWGVSFLVPPDRRQYWISRTSLLRAAIPIICDRGSSVGEAGVEAFLEVREDFGMGWCACRVGMSLESQILYNSSPISAFISAEKDMTFLFNFRGESADRFVSIFFFFFG